MLSAIASVIVAGVLSASAVLPASTQPEPPFDFNTSPDTPPDASASASGDTATVQIETLGSTVEGRPIHGTKRVPVPPPVCYLRRGETGLEYYEMWRDGSEYSQPDTMNDYKYQDLLNPGWDDPVIAADATGHWYEPHCAFEAPTDVSTAFYQNQQSVFVPLGQPVPTQVVVDPRELAQLAAESMVLPKGTLMWNPMLAGSGATIVGTDTWVWVDGAPGTVTVRASIDPNTWAEVVAKLTSIDVDAGRLASTDSCAGTGIAWAADATGDACTIRFTRSTEGTTLTATATWDAYWYSSYDGTTHHPLTIDPLTTTGDIAVAEVQALVTGR